MTFSAIPSTASCDGFHDLEHMADENDATRLGGDRERTTPPRRITFH